MAENERAQIHFSSTKPDDSPGQFKIAHEFIKNYANSKKRIIAIGCKDGSFLSEIRRHAPDVSLTGLDVGSTYMTEDESLKPYKIVSGSVIDLKVVTKLEGNYDICILGSMLHLFIGSSRRESYDTACLCLRNSWRLLKPYGFLILIEPSFSPSFLMNVAFWTKKAFGVRLCKKINLFGINWVEIGKNITPYYGVEQIHMMIKHLKGVRSLEKRITNSTKWGGLAEKMDLGMILRKVPVA